ncbi:MAG: efflux RND transporter periplasmic adaptor subunit [Treponema sp.]|jgi:HlyD family secretion protein|nr:efflux RND transporter periplasmic adaptor subunit [Treponema sp.]
MKARVPVLLLTGLVLFGCGGRQPGTRSYEMTVLRRGTLEKTVSSSGTLNPVSTVKVLPRMSGKVEKIYVDYNDAVNRGDVLAELNTDMLRLQREQQLAQVVKSRANYELQRINYRNQETLAEKNLISEYELKTGKTTLDIQGAELAAAEANLKAIETEINQYAFITSPIDGIVLERTITVGDTVVDSSSSNSSSIFTLAENLREMLIESWVGELDIASIQQGQEVRFTLEALPGRDFTGSVESKRLLPSVQDNVVSYNVIIAVDNQDGSLLPGMTCSVEFIEERRENVLVVPNAALRYAPTSFSAGEIEEAVFQAGLAGMDEERRAAAIAARTEAQKAQAPGQNNRSGQTGTGLAGLLAPMPGGRMGPPGAGGPGGQRGTGAGGGSGMSAGRAGVSGEGREAARLGTLWFMGENGKPACLRVRVGISDGSYTEVQALGPGEPEEFEGREIILRERI